MHSTKGEFMDNTRTEGLNGLRKPLVGDSNYEKSLHDTAQTLGDKAQSLGAMASTFANATSTYLKTGKEYVKQNPNKAVAIAAAAGIVTGSLLSMAMRRKH